MSNKKKYTACVSLKYASVQLIQMARQIADADGAVLSVITVLTEQPCGAQLDILEYLMSAAAEAGAQMVVLFSDSPALAVISYIKKYKVTHIIAGAPSSENTDGGRFLSLLRAVYPKKLQLVLLPEQPVFIKDTVCTLPLSLLLSEYISDSVL